MEEGDVFKDFVEDEGDIEWEGDLEWATPTDRRHTQRQ